jgi:hypothetical protein
MTADQPGYERQKMFDDALIKLNLFEFLEYGPSADVFLSSLKNAGYKVQGFDLERIGLLRGKAEKDGGHTGILA